MTYTIEPKQGKRYDVIVCGGGTAGVCAAIAAGRQGASVLLVERSFSVGGMLTEGNAGITKFTEHCKDPEAYKKEVLDVLGIDYPRLFAFLEENPGFTVQSCGLMDFETVKESYARGDMCVFCVPIDNPDPAVAQRIPRVLVQIYVTPSRTGAVLLSFGPTLTAYTGSGVDAASLSAGHDAMLHGAQTVTRSLQQTYPGFERVRITHIPAAGVRETRHIAGKYKMTALDVISGRDFADSIGCGGHHVDTDTVPEAIRRMSMEHWRYHIPYAVMLPKTVKNLLVAGRAVSATRLAAGTLRVCTSCMQMGEAAGVAAAMAAAQGISPDAIDVQALRAVLAENGAIL